MQAAQGVPAMAVTCVHPAAAELGETPVWCVEEQCLYWVDIGHWPTPARVLVRYRPDGRLDREIVLPVTRPTMVAFGGADLQTLYITTASHRLSPEQRAAQPLAGGIFAVEAGVRGLPEPRFRGGVAAQGAR